MGKKRDQKNFDYGYLQALEDVLSTRIIGPKRRSGIQSQNVGCDKCTENWERGFKAHARHKKVRVRELAIRYIEERGL